MFRFLSSGCDTIFCYPGGQVIDLFDELYTARDRIKQILSAHEQGAAHAADGYARATGKVGVVIATSGPGATNLVTGIATAALDSVPMVAITGNVPCELIGRDSFQEVDIVGVTMPITKHNFIVKDISELADTLRTAFKIAKSGRPGPVLVDIPKDVQTALFEFEANAQPVIPYPITFASEEKLKKAAEMINNAERPYIYFGGGVISGKASAQIIALAEQIDAPMGCSLMGLSAVPCDHPKFLGMQGMHGHYASSIAEDEADLVIALGARFSDRATGNKSRYAKHFSIIHIDIDGAELHKNINADLAIRGDIRDAAERLIAMTEAKKRPQWAQRIEELKKEEAARTASARKTKSGFLHPYDIVDIISAHAGDDTIIATDVGQHQMWAAQYYPVINPRSFLTSGSLGTMGFGLPAAIGASLANPQKRVICFSGDGSIMMNIQELATLSELNLPVTVIVFENGTLGMVYQQQKYLFEKNYSASVFAKSPDLLNIARGFGIEAIDADQDEQWYLKAFNPERSAKPCFVRVRINPEECVLPFVPGGKANIDSIRD